MAVIFNVAGTLPKIKRPKKKIGAVKKQTLTLYRVSVFDRRGQKYYNSSKDMSKGDIYFFNKEGKLFKALKEKDGTWDSRKEPKKEINKKDFNITYKKLY